MRLAFFSDAHLGYQAFYRQDASGVNLRDRDVMASFSRAIDQIIAAAPDATIFGGDLFHAARPRHRVVAFAMRELRRLRASVTGPIVLLAGNHDSPRTEEGGHVFDVLREVDGLHLVYRGAELLEFPALGLSVYAVPDAALQSGHLDLSIRGEGATRVLALHAPVGGVGQNDRSSHCVPATLLDAAWDFICLGDFHRQHQVKANAWYGGSLDFTSSDNWGEQRLEARDGMPGKGWLLADLSTGSVAYQGPTNSRVLIDLPPIEAIALDAAEIMARLEANLALVPGGHADAVVRQVLIGVSRETERLLDWHRIHTLQAEALAYRLDVRRPPKAIVIGSFSDADFSRAQEGAPLTEDDDPNAFDFYGAPECNALDYGQGGPRESDAGAPAPNVDYFGEPFTAADVQLLGRLARPTTIERAA